MSEFFDQVLPRVSLGRNSSSLTLAHQRLYATACNAMGLAHPKLARLVETSWTGHHFEDLKFAFEGGLQAQVPPPALAVEPSLVPRPQPDDPIRTLDEARIALRVWLHTTETRRRDRSAPEVICFRTNGRKFAGAPTREALITRVLGNDGFAQVKLRASPF